MSAVGSIVITELGAAHHLTGGARDIGAALGERLGVIGLTVPRDDRYAPVQQAMRHRRAHQTGP